MRRKYFSGLEKIYLSPTVYFLSFLSNQTHFKKVLFLIFSPKLFIHPVSPLNKYTLKSFFFYKIFKIIYIFLFIFYVWSDKQILIKMIGFISATLMNPFDSWQLPISPIRRCLSYSFITLDSINATRCKKLEPVARSLLPSYQSLATTESTYCYCLSATVTTTIGHRFPH